MVGWVWRSVCPTRPFTILEPQDQDIGEFYVVQERRTTDFEASKLWKGSSGGKLENWTVKELLYFFWFGQQSNTYPTDPFTILEPRNLEIDEFQVLQ